MAAWWVIVQRRGVSPFDDRLLVRAPSRREAAELAVWIAGCRRGGTFEASRIKCAARDETRYAPDVYDDADADLVAPAVATYG